MKYQHLSQIADKCKEFGFKTRLGDLLLENLPTAKLDTSLDAIELDAFLSMVDSLDREYLGILEKRLADECDWWAPVWEDYHTLEFGTRNHQHEALYLQHPQLALWYCTIITEHSLHKAPKEFKKVVIQDARTAVEWADESERHWTTGGTAEQNIAKSAEWSVKYALTYMKRFLLGEPAINADPKWKAEYERLIECDDIDGSVSVERDGYRDW